VQKRKETIDNHGEPFVMRECRGEKRQVITQKAACYAKPIMAKIRASAAADFGAAKDASVAVRAARCAREPRRAARATC